ncbi:MAG: ABC transporter permease [Holophagaceae bacterium]|jgi:sodium transport system permease protein|uniref:ABC transporter permease n=1 Tax=Candidatus Geothrix odensensis TaxID=2954440 RepID=A0A936EZ91_9BACT|nr:ABC transporter permease [Holophagaceae bacterium]MBK8571077.1 ABC transporter permease [Candidatus Geothrix odensensis]
MRGALLIAKKEFLELSKDRKTMFFAFVLPFLLYPAIFGMMAKMGKRDEAQNRNKASRVYVADASGVLNGVLADPKLFERVARPEGDLKQAIRDQKLEMALEADANAAEALQKHQTFTLAVTMDESERASEVALKRLKEALKGQEKAWVQGRLQVLGASSQLAEPVKLQVKNAADIALEVGKAMGKFLPYLLMIMMYTGAMQHGIYATAGEKERQTLLSLMATRLPRNQIILGKLLYIFCMGVIAALLNLLSMGVSIGFMGGGSASSMQAMSAIANPVTLGLTFLIMVPLGLFFSNFILLMGIQAKNTIEAGSAITPGIFLVVFLGVFTMAPGVDKMAFLSYVPVVNVCIALRKMFSQQPNWLEYGIAFTMTVGLAGLMTLVSTRVLNQEKALFKM